MHFDCSALRAARKKAKMRQIEVANLLGISLSTLSFWENGYKEIPAQKLAQLMNLYGAGPKEFFIEKGKEENA